MGLTDLPIRLSYAILELENFERLKIHTNTCLYVRSIPSFMSKKCFIIFTFGALVINPFN